MEYLKKIDGGTTLKEFPEKYNTDNKALVDEINRLNQLLSQKDTEIENLRVAFNGALNRIRSEYIAMFDPDKVPESNGDYVLKAKRTDSGIEYIWVQDE